MCNFTLLSTPFTARQKVTKIEDANYGCKDEGNDDEVSGQLISQLSVCDDVHDVLRDDVYTVSWRV